MKEEGALPPAKIS